MQKKLPIGSAVREIYRLLLKDIGYAARITAPWAILSFVLPASIQIVMGANDLLLGISTVAFILGWLVIAVLWHHRWLRRHEPHLSARECLYRAAGYGWDLFSIGSLFGPVLMLALIIVAIAGISASEFVEHIFDLEFGSDDEMDLALVATALIGVLFFIRLSLVLPATALDIPDFGRWASWKHTRGNGLRLLSVWILTALPPAVPITAYIYFNLVDGVKRLDSDVGPLVILTVALCLLSTILLSTLSLISVAYAFLVENKPIAPPTRSETTGVVIRSRRALSASPLTRP